MDLPKIAALYSGKKPETDKFQKNVERFFEVFIKENWLDVEDPNHRLRFKDYDALVMRPKWGGKLDIGNFNIGDFHGAWNQKFQIATFSVSESKIQLKKMVDEGKVNVIAARYGNLDSTAELAIWLAITLQRKLHLLCMGLSNMHWKNENVGGDIRNIDCLKGKTWAIIGMGRLGSRVLARLPGLGISQVRVYHDGHGDVNEKFETFMKNAFPNWEKQNGMTNKATVEGNPGYDEKGNSIADRQLVEVEVSTDLEEVVKNVDVICLTLPLIHEGKRRTVGLITKKHIEMLKENAIFVNVARAEILNRDIYENLFTEDSKGNFSLKSNKSFSFGSDVLAEDIENDPYREDHNFLTHRVWAAFSASMLGVASGAVSIGRGVLLTPHIGGATCGAEVAVAEEVIGKLLDNFGIREKYEVFYMSGKNLPNIEATTELKDVQTIELNEREKALCVELSDWGYNIEEDWPWFLGQFAKNILPIYTKTGTTVFLQNIEKNEEKLPCDWEFEYQKIEEKTDVPYRFCVCGVPFEGKESEIKFEYSKDNSVFSILLDYKLNGQNVALADWVTFALRIFHTIVSRCEDRVDWIKGKWVLKKGNISLDGQEEVDWKTWVSEPDKNRILMKTQ
jgi:phosphoglycerate dehydrogenase-like enzyme